MDQPWNYSFHLASRSPRRSSDFGNSFSLHLTHRLAHREYAPLPIYLHRDAQRPDPCTKEKGRVRGLSYWNHSIALCNQISSLSRCTHVAANAGNKIVTLNSAEAAGSARCNVTKVMGIGVVAVNRG